MEVLRSNFMMQLHGCDERNAVYVLPRSHAALHRLDIPALLAEQGRRAALLELLCSLCAGSDEDEESGLTPSALARLQEPLVELGLAPEEAAAAAASARHAVVGSDLAPRRHPPAPPDRAALGLLSQNDAVEPFVDRTLVAAVKTAQPIRCHRPRSFRSAEGSRS